MLFVNSIIATLYGLYSLIFQKKIKLFTKKHIVKSIRYIISSYMKFKNTCKTMKEKEP